MCWFSVWAGQRSNPSLRTMGRSFFPYRSIDGWGSPLPFPRTARSHVVEFPLSFSFHAPPFRPCVDEDLSLSFPRVCETETGVACAPSPVLPPRAFPLRYQPKRDETFGFFSSSEGRDGLGTFEDVSDRWTPFVWWGRVVGGRSETRSHGGADPHPSPPKILPRRTTHPRPKQV